MLPDSVLQIIYNYVPHEVYDYMDGLVELMQIAEETGVTVLERLQQERAMRRAYEAMPAELPSSMPLKRSRISASRGSRICRRASGVSASAIFFFSTRT